MTYVNESEDEQKERRGNRNVGKISLTDLEKYIYIFKNQRNR